MNIRTTIAAGVLLAALASGSAFAAQGSMSTMSKADMDKVTACKAMPKDAMMKDKKCVSLSKMKSSGMMSSDSMGAASPMAGPQAKDKMGPMPASK